MKKILRSTAMIIVSAFLFWLGWKVYQHQSSSAFESSIAIWLAAIFHWAFWPRLKDKPHEH